MQFLRSLCFISVLVCGSFAYADVSSALRGCINDSNDDLTKTRVDGTADTVVMLSCSGDSAAALWEAVRFYSREWGPNESDMHSKRMIRSFGNLGVPSMCLRTYQDASGHSVNSFTCFVGIDLSSSVVKAM